MPNSKVSIELTTLVEDWKIIRECYVRSFYRYPLYTYMVPDESKREEFLRAYLDANYEVTVGSGHGILLRIRITKNQEKTADLDLLRQHKPPSEIVGGVVFVPPSSDGCGWAINSDEPYWEAYEKYKLGQISKKGLERVKRYEAWENQNISEKLKRARVPMWNGLFCAIKPEYTSQGVGSSVYKEAIRIMAEYWLKQNRLIRKDNLEVKRKPKRISDAASNDNVMTNLLNMFSIKNLHYFTMLSHRPLPIPTQSKPNANQLLTDNQNKTKGNLDLLDILGSTSAPLVVAISHSTRAAKFHESNGFQQLIRLPYYDPIDDVTPFFTHVLTLDPFRTGKMNKLYNEMNSNYIKSSKDFESEMYDHYQGFVLL